MRLLRSCLPRKDKGLKHDLGGIMRLLRRILLTMTGVVVIWFGWRHKIASLLVPRASQRQGGTVLGGKVSEIASVVPSSQ